MDVYNTALCSFFFFCVGFLQFSGRAFPIFEGNSFPEMGMQKVILLGDQTTNGGLFLLEQDTAERSGTRRVL